MDIDHFRQSHLSLVSGSPNCSEGHVWVWRRLGQCLERTEQTLGFLCGILAVFLWTAAHVTIYKFQRQHARVKHTCNIRVFLATHWVSDVLGCVGAVLAQQLTTQIILSLSAMFVNTVCSAHYLILPLTATRKKFIPQRKVHSRSSLSSRLIKCLFPLIAMFALLTESNVLTIPPVRKEMIYVTLPQPFVPALWIVGYTLGTMAAVLLCGVKLVDICDSYFTSDFNIYIGLAYGSSIMSEILYVVSVFTQSQSLGFFYHSMPWTLPRLICSGIDCGILIQRIIQKRRTKRRKLSTEDTACLLSSDTDYADVSSSESEEVIWMPLKTIQLPQHPVTTSRIQILSESDAMSDKVEYLCDSGQFSMSSPDGQMSLSDTVGTFMQQNLLAAGTPTGDDEDKNGFKADQSTSDKDSHKSFDNELGDNLSSEEGSKSKPKSQSYSDDVATTTDDEDEEKESKQVLERQISSLSAVSSEEKIAVWIQSAPRNEETVPNDV